MDSLEQFLNLGISGAILAVFAYQLNSWSKERKDYQKRIDESGDKFSKIVEVHLKNSVEEHRKTMALVDKMDSQMDRLIDGYVNFSGVMQSVVSELSNIKKK